VSFRCGFITRREHANVNVTLNPQALALLAIGVLAAAGAMLVSHQHAMPRVRLLRRAIIALAIWAVVDGLASWHLRGDIVLWVTWIRYVAAAVLPVAWYGLVMGLVSGGRRPTAIGLTRLGLIPAITALLAATNVQHGWLWAVWVHIAYGLGVLAVGCVALRRYVGRGVGQVAHRAWILGLLGVIALLASVAGLQLGLGWGAVAMHLALIVSCWLLIAALLRRRTPVETVAIAQGLAENGHTNGAVLALDRHDRVIDANAPALLLLAEHGVWRAVGRHASDVLAGPLAPLAAVGTDGAATIATTTRLFAEHGATCELEQACTGGPIRATWVERCPCAWVRTCAATTSAPCRSPHRGIRSSVAPSSSAILPGAGQSREPPLGEESLAVAARTYGRRRSDLSGRHGLVQWRGPRQ